MPLSSQVADFFAVLGDMTRIRILGIVHNNPLTVNKIRDELGISPQALSYQLKRLEEHHLIKYEIHPEDKRKKMYSLADEHIVHILNDAISHLISSPECDGRLDCEDMENLKLLMVKK